MCNDNNNNDDHNYSDQGLLCFIFGKLYLLSQIEHSKLWFKY